MKSIQKIVSRINRVTYLLAVLGLTFVTMGAAAQEKGAERLTKLNRLDTVADVQKVEAGDTVVMSCPKCKESWVTVIQSTGKGASPTVAKTVARHECPGCQTKIVTDGVGKQAENKVIHTCKKCGSTDAFCCVMKKGAGATKGMDEHKH